MLGRPSLRDLQLELESLLSRGGHASWVSAVAAAAERLPVRGDDRLNAAERLEIYASMVFLRIREAIGEDFPASVAAVGEEGWSALISAYLETHPTDDPSLRQAGRWLPEFLRRAGNAELPWQAELAELEWAMVRAFDAPDERLLTAAWLETLSPEAWAELPLQTTASLVLLEPAFAVDSIRQRLLEGGTPEPERATSPLRVWRQGFSIYHRRITPLECEALRRLESGLAFAEVCEWLAERVPADEVASTGMELLHGWLADELLVSPEAADVARPA